MGLNAYLAEVDSKGYKTESAGTVIEHDIDPKTGKRVVILGYGATAGTAADTLYFMNPTKTTVNGAVSSGASTVVLTADPTDPSGNAIAGDDKIAIQQSDGAYQYTNVSSWTASTLTAVLSTALTGAVSDGANFFNFGAVGDNGHYPVSLSASGQTKVEQDVGIFFGTAKSYPVKAVHANAVDTNSIDWITIGYVNK